MRILIIEDDKRTGDFIKRGLEEEGFAVDTALSGEEGLRLVAAVSYDLIILDIMLPGKDGYEVCRILRDEKIDVPILMLTGKQEVVDRVTGLNSGADDYLLKPFAFDELVARVRALLRRVKQTVPAILQVGPLIMNIATRQVTFRQTPVELTAKEYAILEYLMRHPDTVVTRVVLEQHVWNQEFESTSNLVDVNINRIRHKIGPEGEALIQSIRGAGYRLVTL